MIGLSKDKNARSKITIFLGVVALLVLFLLVHFVILPFFQDMRSHRARAAELENSIWKARHDLDTTERNRLRNTETVAAILYASETQRHILRPSLGNYLLVASDILTSHADALDLKLDSVTEITSVQNLLPAPDGKERNRSTRFAPYTVNVSLTAGLHRLARLMHQMEASNPYLSVTRLVVMEQSEKTPDAHAVNLHIQWPIWIENDHPQRLAAEQLVDEEQH